MEKAKFHHEAKTGSGPILLTLSFPYVRDWLNEHPFRNEPNARLICNLSQWCTIKIRCNYGNYEAIKNKDY